MPEEDIEVVRRIYAEVVARPEAVRELYAPDFELDVTDTGPDIGVVRGFEPAMQALRPYFEMFDDFHIEIDEVISDASGHLVLAVHDGGRMHGTDSEIRNERFHNWTLRDGRAVRLSTHLDRNRALEAAGVSQ